MQQPTVEVAMRGITKTFPGVIADDNVDFTVYKGEIHALMGENGAGKSILMSILAGVYQPDSGTISIGGKPCKFNSPLDAIAAGVGMVFQSFKLFPSLTITENVVFRAEPTKKGLFDQAKATAKVAAIAEKYGLQVDPQQKVADATVGVLQRVEIIKALYREAKILILDEPTAVLTPQETQNLFQVLKTLKEHGHTIIIITHKLAEVLAISDRVTVLRDGKNVAELITKDTTAQELTRYMTGRDVDLTMPAAANPPGKAALTVTNLTVPGASRNIVDNVSLTVHSGEIVGIAGVAGNGQVELAEAIMGMRESSGQISINSTDCQKLGIMQRRNAGIAYIPEDRHGVGSADTAGATENLSLVHHRKPPLLKNGLLARARMVAHAKTLIKRFGVKIASHTTPVGTLSGGNLQKIVVARELATNSPVLIAEQPTRGVDIGAIAAIHRELTNYRDNGGALLLISAELSEIMALSSRILVMFEGRIVANLDRKDATEALLGLYMAGHDAQATSGEG